MQLLKKLTMLFAAIAISLPFFAQTPVKGKVIDSENGEPLMRSTVMVMTADTLHMVTGTTTSEDGSFTIKSVKDGNYIVKISYMGYHNFFRALSINHAKQPSVAMGTAMMIPSSVELKAAVVTAQLKEVEVKDDTIMFNADAFKVPQGSVLEELIRKLPGVTVEDDGTIKVNGKTVKRIMVDGKEFFGNDQNMAMKNIPTEIVDKIKTYDRQSDLTRITGIDDGEEETVIDLSIKKGMKKGWFGNVNLGYGTKERWDERVMVNRFKDGFQSSVIGSLNNTNGQTGGGGGRGGNSGNNRVGQLGGNLVVALNNFELGGNVRYNYRKTDNSTNSSSQNFVRAASYSNNRNQSINHNNNVNGDFKIEWKIDTLTTILFRPNFGFSDTDSRSGNRSATFNDDPYAGGVTNPLDQMNLIDNTIKVNENSSTNRSEGSSYNLGGNLTFNRRLKGKPWFGPSAVRGTNGRNISFRVNGSASGNENKSFNYSQVIYHQRNDSTDITYRHRNTPSNNRNYSFGVTYSEPILRNMWAQFNYSYNYSKRHSDGQTYDFAKIDEIGKTMWEEYGQYGLLAPNYLEFLSDSLSRYTDNINKTNNFEFSLRYVTQLLNISAGVNIDHQNQEMKYMYQGLDTVASRSFMRISPTLNARLRFSRQHSLRFTYRGSSQQPDMTSLFNLTDNSNPLNIREGNPDLKPSFNNRFSIEYNNAFVERNQSIFGRFNFSNTLNSISNRTQYNAETGGQVTRPENINGNWNLDASAGFNTPLWWDKLTLNSSTSYGFSNHVSYLYQNKETVKNLVKNTNLGERLSLTIRLNQIDIRANGNINWSKSTSDVVAATNQSTYRFHYGFSSTGNFNNGLGYSTDFGVNGRRGYSSSTMNTNELIWNASVSYRFLKRKQATLSLSAYDILNQRSNISRSIDAYSRRDTETNSINSYLMARFIYRINLFGSRQGRQELRAAQAERERYDRESQMEERGGERGGNERSGNRGGERGGNRGGFGGNGGGGRF